MKKTILTGAIAAGLLSFALNAPHASADFIYKSSGCPGNGKTIVPAGSRFEINDIIISSNKDQTVVLKFTPSGRILTKLFLKARTTFQTNLSGEVESENEQALKMDCSGNNGTTVTVTITGNGNL